MKKQCIIVLFLTGIFFLSGCAVRHSGAYHSGTKGSLFYPDRLKRVDFGAGQGRNRRVYSYKRRNNPQCERTC